MNKRTTRQPRRPNYDNCRAERDRLNPGEYVVKDAGGNVLASGFDSCDEANEWIETKQRG